MYQKINDIISCITGLIGLSMINDILGIIILILSIANILFNLTMRIYSNIKNKKYGQISEDLQNAIEEIEKIKDGDDDVE